MDFIQMSAELGLLNADETSILGLRLLKCFLALRSRQRRETLLAFAERLLGEEQEVPAEPAD